jgi:hypothetical protein
MKKTSNETSAIGQALGFFKSGPIKTTSHAARKTSAKKIAGVARKTSTSKTATIARSTNQVKHYPYRSASISAEKCNSACEAVKAIQGQRFLLQDVPTIPMPECTSRNCQCGYVRYKDRRRAMGERRALFGLNSSRHVDNGEPERRERRGRRHSDDPDIDLPGTELDIAEWSR